MRERGKCGLAFEDVLVTEFSETHRGRELGVGDSAGDEVLRKGEVTVIRPIANHDIGGFVGDGKVLCQIVLGLGRKSVFGFELTVLQKDGEPVEDAVLRIVEVEDGEILFVDLVAVSPSVVILRDSPLLCQLLAFGAIEPETVVVVSSSETELRRLDDVLRSVVKGSHHA